MNTNNRRNMKRIPGRILVAVVAAASLLWALPASAGSKTSHTVWGYPQYQLETYSDDAFSFPGGNLHIHHIYGVSLGLSDTPLLTGIIFWGGNLQWDAEGNGVMNLTWRTVVGDVSGMALDDEGYILDWDGVGLPPGFEPTGGIWEGNIHAEFAGGVETLHATGKGVAGEVDGFKVQARMQGSARPEVQTDVITDPKAEK